jgi:hypothetical protein
MSNATNLADAAIASDGTPIRDTQFGWFKVIGATDEAVMVLNDQPILFTILLVVLVSLIVHGVLLWYIHFATLKPEQKKKKTAAKPGDKKGAGAAGRIKGFFPPALRR